MKEIPKVFVTEIVESVREELTILREISEAQTGESINLRKYCGDILAEFANRPENREKIMQYYEDRLQRKKAQQKKELSAEAIEQSWEEKEQERKKTILAGLKEAY